MKYSLTQDYDCKSFLLDYFDFDLKSLLSGYELLPENCPVK